jgi:uncharacterized Zn-binding protein involved in type VI secretion
MATGGVILLILGVVFFGIGALFLFLTLRARQKAKTSQGWPTAQGRVLAVDIQEHRSYDGDHHHTRVSYEPVVQYQYTVSGRQYNNKRIAFGATSFDRSTAQKKASQYATGMAVSVHYNPNKPEESVLETSASGSTVFMVVGILFAVIGLMGCCGSMVIFLLAATAK